jgi:hypothetical protein
MATTSRNARQSAAANVKAERALDKLAAMQEYEAEQLELRARTERLRALRLAREAEDKQAAGAPKPGKKAAPDATTVPLRVGAKARKRS